MAFCDNIYRIVRKIPKGKVATYGQIALVSGNPKSARAVGMCLKKNPFAPNVPCHRVVAADGSLRGYSAGQGIKTKKEMLIYEGVKFIKGKVDLSKSRFIG
jgi:O-6-methylguanine DNA methyltransferase